MSDIIVQVIENEAVDAELNPTGKPDMGPDISVTNAMLVLPYETGSGKKWWKAFVKAENSALKAWRDEAGNVGWISSQGPTTADASKIWAHLKALIEADTPAGHTVWLIAPALKDEDGIIIGPDMDPFVGFDATKLHIDRTSNERKLGLWSGDLAAGQGAAANAWLTAHPGRGWNGSLPADGGFIVREIAQMGREGQTFMFAPFD